MAALVDIHAHLLPGIDDGPDDMEETVAMARAAVESGIGTMAATPHLRSDFPGVHIEELAERAEDVRAALARDGSRCRSSKPQRSRWSGRSRPARSI
jgi:protein-tyrosine phosphatase